MARYLEARDRTRRQFAEAYANVLQSFEVSVHAFGVLGEELKEGRDRAGHTHTSLAPFFFLFQRQAMAAFDTLSSGQAYQAWLAIRPGVESILIMGKWVDDKRNSDIWSAREENRDEYQKVYQGRRLESRSLPRSPQIRVALSRINDLFVHPNPYYYYRHLAVTDVEGGLVEISVNFFDDDENLSIGILGLLHLVTIMQDSLAQMFAALFVDTRRVDVGLYSLEQSAGDWASKLMADSPIARRLLVEIGLWPPPA